ncbi:MAG: SAM-dependent methyltransferase, partial [Proteobacteria bacterium]
MNSILKTLLPLEAMPMEEKSGVVYTKAWVIDLILDLVGYTSDQPLFERQIVEPAAGSGAFLHQIVARLAVSCQLRNLSLMQCRSAIKAYELDADSAMQCRVCLHKVLQQHGLSSEQAENLASAWVHTGDYLLESITQQNQADYVVGNPPYIRLEDLYEGGAQYRALYKTMVGRADIYVAFYEAALRQLKTEGVCGLICADRWMFNQYGAELRNFITKRFAVEAVIQMHHADAFDREVSAYPAVTIIRNGCQGPVVVA